ncbi:hypothetical protein RvY_03804 [Ramazzottius varieornatus]|uniref:Uncharacterized protein n=1 Tax=Ramazzottius varieornatus TaxID=947166 RepID=A0A1D1UPB9_RAMVA|nr:hypothetical protein RvY_03804 [Ramazzottius varieornatus]
MCNVGGQRRGFFFFAVVGCALLTFAPCGTIGFDFIPYGPGKSLETPSPEAVQVFRQGLPSAGLRVKRDSGFGSFEGGESGGLNNLLFLSLLQQMAASSPPAAAAPAPAAGAEAPAATPPAAPASPSPSLASLLPRKLEMKY